MEDRAAELQREYDSSRTQLSQLEAQHEAYYCNQQELMQRKKELEMELPEGCCGDERMELTIESEVEKFEALKRDLTTSDVTRSVFKQLLDQGNSHDRCPLCTRSFDTHEAFQTFSNTVEGKLDYAEKLQQQMSLDDVDRKLKELHQLRTRRQELCRLNKDVEALTFKIDKTSQRVKESREKYILFDPSA